MSSYFIKIFYALLLLLLHVSGSALGFNWTTKNTEGKCIERERQALLNFKQSIVDNSANLSTDENDGDYCKWKEIECNNETGHIQKLDLHGQYLIGAIDITSLIDLQNMEYMDLSNNDFGGSHIPELMGSFTELIYLDLSVSGVGGRIPYQLGNLSKLEYLNFRKIDLVGAIPSLLGLLTRLQYLDLSDNYINGEIPFQLGNLSQLRHLDLRGNSLSGAILFQIGNLRYLHTLRLGGNFHFKTEDGEWLLAFYSLTNLDLSLLHNLGSLTNLRELRLVGCGLLDNDISSLFHSHANISTSLTILDLSSNMLTLSAFQLLSNFSLNLEELYLSNNNIVLSSPLYPSFPSLVILDLSYNNLTSLIFQDNFNFSSKLQKLNLRNCSFMDRSFPLSSTSIMNSSSSLVVLHLSSNMLKLLAIFLWLFNFTTNLHILSNV